MFKHGYSYLGRDIKVERKNTRAPITPQRLLATHPPMGYGSRASNVYTPARGPQHPSTGRSFAERMATMPSAMRFTPRPSPGTSVRPAHYERTSGHVISPAPTSQREDSPTIPEGLFPSSAVLGSAPFEQPVSNAAQPMCLAVDAPPQSVVIHPAVSSHGDVPSQQGDRMVGSHAPRHVSAPALDTRNAAQRAADRALERLGVRPMVQIERNNQARDIRAP